MQTNPPPTHNPHHLRRRLPYQYANAAIDAATTTPAVACHTYNGFSKTTVEIEPPTFITGATGNFSLNATTNPRPCRSSSLKSSTAGLSLVTFAIASYSSLLPPSRNDPTR
ncbi:hypothetical protein Hanom_Chr07g00652561 [Helianthus anomalus]